MEPKSDFAVLLTWEENPKKLIGPGISRAQEGERTKPFTLRVMQGNALPMKVTLQAPTKKLAVKYAQNRWPGAVVEVA